ncbi:MAG: PorT family protein [Bacteroidetes bacterium CHB5]|nr:PorT family protein [Bacteroidetes bacterium CHB5]
MRRFYILVLFVFFTSGVMAQGSSCAQAVRLAQSVYDQGRLHELEDIINKALNNPNALCEQSEKVSLLKLLTLTYIYLEEPEKADATMLKLLQTDNYFQINPAVDPAEFVALYNTFRTHEIYRIGAALGVNATQPNVTNTISAVELSEGSKYRYAIAILFGASADVPLDRDDKLTLHSELLYSQKKFNLELITDRSLTGDGSITNQFQGVETQNWISLPLSLEYKLEERKSDKKFYPFVSGGVVFDYLLNSKITSEVLRTNTTSIQEATFELNPQRVNTNISLQAGAGVKFQMGGGYFIARVWYTHGLTNINSLDTSYANEQATWGQGYADPVYKISSLSLSGSYVINMFNPKKRTIKAK